eukprot:1434998-Pyramimonas_sp.AAC.1
MRDHGLVDTAAGQALRRGAGHREPAGGLQAEGLPRARRLDACAGQEGYGYRRVCRARWPCLGPVFSGGVRVYRVPDPRGPGAADTSSEVSREDRGER